ncbi:MAG: protein translocase subunit SecF [Propionibacteriaceae bacterium]|jgi:preprotein translocase subunit SecF|nr:protein translocase subunit SecF [Propionibacteriaceae bacterium]
MSETTIDTETVEAEIVESEVVPAAKPHKVSFAHKLWTGEIEYDFVGHRKWWYLISAVLLIVSIGSLLFFRLDLGIEFRGGSDFKVNVTSITPGTVDEFRSAVTNSGVDNLDATVVTTIGDTRVAIETRALSVDEVVSVRAAIAAQAGTESDRVDYQQIGASWGKQVTRQAGIALVIFVVLVSALIWAYFRDWKMAVSAIVALFHDMIITVGVYSLVGFSVTPATLTGLLTILGYSLYDTVVVFDKVRENTANLDDYRITYREAANKSINQVLVRSINTTVIGVLPVAAILFAGTFVLGSGPLEDIGLALFVGMIIGAYSSIFLATPLLSQLREAEPGMKTQAERVAKRREKLAKAGEVEAAAPIVTYTTPGELDPALAGVRNQRTKTTRSRRTAA